MPVSLTQHLEPVKGGSSQVMRFHRILKHGNSLRDVVAVTDAERQIHAARITRSNVGNHIAPNLSVWNDDHFVVDRDDRRGNDIHRLNSAPDATKINEVPLIKGAIDHDHQPTRVGPERFLKGETDDKGGTAHQCQQRRDVDS